MASRDRKERRAALVSRVSVALILGGVAFAIVSGVVSAITEGDDDPAPNPRPFDACALPDNATEYDYFLQEQCENLIAERGGR